MIYRIRNPWTWADEGTVTELDSDNGRVIHRRRDGSTEPSEYTFTQWLRKLQLAGKNLHTEHELLLGDLALDEGL